MTERITRKIADTLNRVPGYTGYRAKEDRRDADRRVREQIAADLAAYAVRVERIAAARADARDILAVGPIGQLASSVRLLQDRVATASYGYGGLFGDRDVDELALDQLQEFDAGLLERVGGLEPDIAAVEAAPDDAARTAALDIAVTTVRDLQTFFRARADVIETGRPSPLTDVSSPLEVLASAPDPALSAPETIVAIGDAVTVSGSNFVVNAVIGVFGAQAAILARIEATPERWLLFGSGADPLVADLTIDTADPMEPTTAVGTSKAKVTGVAGKSGERSLLFAVSMDGPADRPVRVALDFGQDALHLAGTVLDPNDVEVYRRSS